MALSCKLANNILKNDSCGYMLQSVVDIYLINKADVSAITINNDTEVSAITLVGDAKVYHIEPAKNSASFTDALAITDASKYRTHTLSFSVNNTYNASMVEAIHALSLGEFVAVAKMANGTFVMLGNNNVGLAATVVTNTGAASATEASGVQVELACDIDIEALPLADEAEAAFLAQVSDGTASASAQSEDGDGGNSGNSGTGSNPL